MLGTVLAIALISGSLIAVDSAASGLVRSVVDAMPYDMTAVESYPVPDLNRTLIEDHATTLETADHVAGVASLAVYGMLDYRNPNGPTTSDMSGRIVIVHELDEGLLESYKIEGALPDPGTVAISKHTSSALGLGVGDTIEVLAHRSEYDQVNMTYVSENLTIELEISEVWSQDQIEIPNIQGGMSFWYPYEDSVMFGGFDPVVMRIEDAPLVSTPMKDFTSNSNLMVWYEITIDREEIINLGDLSGTLASLHKMEGQLAYLAEENGFEFRDNMLVPLIGWVRSELDRMKVTIVALSLPVVALGGFLSAVGVDLGSKSRRQEVAALRSRGASGRQIKWLLMSEAIGLGAISGVVGLPLGILLSRGLSTFALAFSNHPPNEPIAPIPVVTALSIALSIIAGILIMLGSSYRPFRRFSRLEVSEGLRGYVESEASSNYSPRMDIVLIALSGLGIFSALVGEEAHGQLFRWMFQSVLGFVMMVGLAIMFAVPLLLTIGIVRMTVHGSRKVYIKLAWFVRPLTKQLHFIVEKNMTRNSRRAANLCLMISMALAFGIFMSVTIASSMSYEKRVVETRVGADIKVNGAFPSVSGLSPSDLNLSRIVGFRDLAGVESAVEFQTFPVGVKVENDSYGMRATVLDADDYNRIVDPSGFFFDGSPEESFRLIETKGNVLISELNAYVRGLAVGDQFLCWFTQMSLSGGSVEYEEVQFTVTVVGIVNNLPGFQWTELYFDWSTFDGIEFDQFYPLSSEFAGSLIQLSGDADSTVVAQEIETEMADSGFSAEIVVLDEELAILERDPSYRALSDFMYVEFGLLIVITGVGLGLMTFAAEADREQELASIMARGAGKSQMRTILVGETLTYLLIGCVVGLSVGFFTGSMFNMITGKTVFTVVERTLVLGPETAFVVIASIASLIIASMISAARAGRLRLAEILRIRNG
jgi:ABC-type lipoprotein release transport system permease subunit